ncbi:MAG TPA: hypothetical protein VFI46_05805 [Jiangellaceae bacterium]|nr:hypothetical protein [Jiangellaceae bacterium]
MTDKPTRVTADVSQYPDLVVIYLGMRVKKLRGVKTLLSFGPKIQASVQARPDGLLLHEYLVYSLLPPHFIDMPPLGFAKFAPTEPARGTMFSARRRLGRSQESKLPPAVSEDALYRS